MEKKDIERLKLRRQFLLTPVSVNVHGDFRVERIRNEYYLNYHSDLLLTRASSGERTLYILGNLFDPFKPEFSNEDIARELVRYSFEELLEKSKIYAGRYIIIYSSPDELKIFHDLFSHLKVYWAEAENKIWCGSQPHILAGFLHMKETEDQQRLQVFNSSKFKKEQYVVLMSHTIYDGIQHLQPNHYLNVQERYVKRYWPDETIVGKNIREVVKNGSLLLKGYLQSAANRYKLMIPVTAGYESRALLAASKDIRDRCYYYVNWYPEIIKKPYDISIPEKLLPHLGLEFHVLKPPEVIDPDFIRIYNENCIAPFPERIPTIYNYYVHFENYFNTSGLGGETMGSAWKYYINQEIDGRGLAKIFDYVSYPFVVKVFDDWLKEIKPICKKYNVGIPNLFYLEFRLSGWGVNYQANKDISQDEFLPFNSRRLLSELHSAPTYYRQLRSKRVVVRMAKHLWKETLVYPFNPKLEHIVKMWLERLYLFNFLARLFSRKP